MRLKHGNSAYLVGLQVEVVVGALGGHVGAIQAEHLHGGRLGQRALQRVEVVLLRGPLCCLATALHKALNALLEICTAEDTWQVP